MLSVASQRNCFIASVCWTSVTGDVTARTGSSGVCKALRGVCLSLLVHQMGGVYSVRQYHEWQDVHTVAMKYLTVSLEVGFYL